MNILKWQPIKWIRFWHYAFWHEGELFREGSKLYKEFFEDEYKKERL